MFSSVFPLHTLQTKSCEQNPIENMRPGCVKRVQNPFIHALTKTLKCLLEAHDLFVSHRALIHQESCSSVPAVCNLNLTCFPLKGDTTTLFRSRNEFSFLRNVLSGKLELCKTEKYLSLWLISEDLTDWSEGTLVCENITSASEGKECMLNVSPMYAQCIPNVCSMYPQCMLYMYSCTRCIYVNVNDKFNVWNHGRSQIRPIGPPFTSPSTDEASKKNCPA